VAAWQAGTKIDAIKRLREHTGLVLKQVAGGFNAPEMLLK
jgi:ribosomal protein L7/L12